MRNTIYIVEFDGNKLLNGEFDFKEEAIEWAEEHLSEKPIVKAIDIEFPDEFGGEPIIHEEEEIFHYPVEEVETEEISDVEEDDVLKELYDFANSIDADAADVDLNDEVFDEMDVEGDKLHRDFPEYESLEVKEDLDVNSSARDVASELNATLNNWDLGLDEEVKPEENLEEDVILFDPFGCDFSECEPMEVCKDEHRADCCNDLCASPADFLRELAAELGIADEVEISEKECADGSCEEKHEDEIPCEDCKDEISEISDEAKDPEDVVPEEVKANEEPNVEVQGEVPPCVGDECENEKPAEESPAINITVDTANLEADKVEEIANAVTDAVEDVEKPEGTTVAFGVGDLTDKVEEPVEEAICPECGKEICESFNLNYFDGRNIKETDYNKVIDICLQADLNGNQDGLNLVGEYDDEDNIIRTIWTDEEGFLDVNPEDEDLKENKELVEKNKVTHTTGDPAIGDAHFNGAFEGGEGCSEDLVKEEKLIDDTKGKDDLINALKEDADKDLEEASSAEKKAYHNGGKAMDDLIQGKAIARIKDPAARTAAIAAVKAGRSEVAKNFYGDRKEDQAEDAFVKKGEKMMSAGIKETKNCELEDKMLFMEEQEEMSDLELAERLEAAKKEKHCEK